jgi:hypothetical protein
MIVAGAATVLYFVFGYDTTVEVSSQAGIPGIFEHVQNLGLEFNRLIGVLVGLTVSLSGIILVAAPAQASGAKK